VVDIPVPPGWKPWGLLPDGRLFLVDGAKLRAALLYPSGGGPVTVTDLLVDHSHQRSGEVARLAATRPGQPLRTVVEEDWIVVGGVRIPRRRVESTESA